MLFFFCFSRHDFFLSLSLSFILTCGPYIWLQADTTKRHEIVTGTVRSLFQTPPTILQIFSFMCSKQCHFRLVSGYHAWLANLFKSLHQKGVATAVVQLSVTQATTSRVHNMFNTVIPLPLLLLRFCANVVWMNEHMGYRRVCVCVCARVHVLMYVCVRGCLYTVFEVCWIHFCWSCKAPSAHAR